MTRHTQTQEMNLHDYPSISGSHLNAKCGLDTIANRRPETVGEAMNQLRELIAVSGKLTEELCNKLSPLMICSPDDAKERLRVDSPDGCPLANDILGIRRAVHVNIDRLQFLLNEVQL